MKKRLLLQSFLAKQGIFCMTVNLLFVRIL